VLNRTRDATTVQTPFERWFSKPATLMHVRVFGCRAFALDHCDKRSKLGSQARAATYLGPASEHNHTHRLLLDDTKKVIITRDVIFQERVMPAKRVATPPGSETVNNGERHIKPPNVRLYKVPPTTKGIRAAKRTGRGRIDLHDGAIGANRVDLAQQDDTVDTVHTRATRQRFDALRELSRLGDPPDDVDMPDLYDPDLRCALTTDSRGDTEINPAPNAPRRSQRTRTPNVRLQELASIASEASKTPNSYKDTLASPDAARWQKAMQEEFEALMRNGTYVLVPLP
jgi:hypothetical protein